MAPGFHPRFVNGAIIIINVSVAFRRRPPIDAVLLPENVADDVSVFAAAMPGTRSRSAVAFSAMALCRARRT